MVSDFRKKKLTYLFNSFFDSDESGSITKKDFELNIHKIAKAKGWVEGDEAFKQAEKAMMEIWEGMQSQADKNKDNEINLEEWISLWEEAFKNPSETAMWQLYYCKAIFFIQDASGNGAIEKDEFVNVHSAFGSPKEDAEKAFEKAVNGKESISWEDFQKLWQEFFVSEDENAPGNFIFGNLDF